MASAPPSVLPHSNIFVRGLPLNWTEADITTVFQQYGSLTSIRLVRHSVTKHSLGYGFVRFQKYEDAQAAINALDGTAVQNQTLQVKFADADAGPPTASPVSGLTPSESVYVKHLPSTTTPADVQALFETAGAVQDVKLFPCLDAFRGASALVRMVSLEDSDRAIAKLNNTTPAGALQSLVVRYAESAAEKAARLTRRNPAALAVAAAAMARGLPPPTHLRGALAALGSAGALQGMRGAGMVVDPAAVFRGSPALVNGHAPGPASVAITGLPPSADRLWIYETFAVFGAILGVHVLEDASGQCNGTGLVTYSDGGSAERASLAMNGARFGESVLSAAVQPPAMHQALSGGALASVMSQRTGQSPVDVDGLHVSGGSSGASGGHLAGAAGGGVGAALTASSVLESRWVEWAA